MFKVGLVTVVKRDGPPVSSLFGSRLVLVPHILHSTNRVEEVETEEQPIDRKEVLGSGSVYFEFHSQ